MFLSVRENMNMISLMIYRSSIHLQTSVKFFVSLKALKLIIHHIFLTTALEKVLVSCFPNFSQQYG